MKSETITIRTTEEERAQLQRIADQDRRPLGGLLYLWIVDRLEQERNKESGMTYKESLIHLLQKAEREKDQDRARVLAELLKLQKERR